LNNKALEFVKSYKNLGVVMDEGLSWKEHIRGVCSRVYGVLRSLRSSPFKPGRQLKATLINALAMPLIDYCSVVFCDLSKELEMKLHKALNSCIRYIFNLSWDAHVTEYYLRLGWLKVRERRVKCLTSLAFKVVKTEKPFYLFEWFKNNVAVQTSTRNKNGYVIPVHRTSAYNRSFLVKAIRELNGCQEMVNSCRTADNFNKLLKENLLQKMFSDHQVS